MSAQVAAPQAAAPNLEARFPLDPEIRTGTLPNGLTFFIRHNEQPDNRVALRLVVKAGSIDEAPDQLGLAHLLEHMAFNGSARFPTGELVKYLESIGARFGADVNAYTSFDETVYMLEVPTDREGLVTRGLEALGDFAGGITLNPAEIDKERGVVLEEWRLRQGAGSRMQDAQLRGLFGESRYVDRLPIGTPEVLKSFPAQRVRDFYDEFYRPDRMAVIAVGDIDVAEMERLIRAEFTRLQGRQPATRPIYPVPPHQGTRYVTVSDREAQQSTVSILYKRPKAPFNTVGDYRRIFVRSMAHQMLNERFAEMAQDPNAPFLRASSNDDTLGRDTEAFSLSLRVNDGAMDRGLEALGQEIARVRQHGFGEAELDRAKRSTLAGYERAFNERNRQQTNNLAAELVRHFLEGEPVPGIEIEADMVRGFLPTITAAEVSTMARELLGTENNIVVMSVTPEKDGLAPVTQARLQTSLRAGLAATTTPWTDTVTNRDLLATRPAAGSVRARREVPELGAVVLTLSNGGEVWLKPTTFRNDQIQFTSYAPGGLSLASEAEYLNASLAVALTGLSGYGGINPTDMGKILAGRLANASPYISTYTHGVSGGTTPRDLETALQLVHLSFTSPDSDPQALELMKRRLLANIANQEQNPGTVFGERLRILNTMNHYTAKPLRAPDVETLNADRMLAFYKARFANAADFTFFFVGAFTEAQITPLLNQYIASLPSTGTKTSKMQNINARFPMGVTREVVNKGLEPRATTVMSFFADTNIEDLEVHRLRAATQVLQMRLRDILREELGGTYSVGVGYSDTTPMPGYGMVSVQFGSSPENVEKLRDAVMNEMDRLRREGPSATDVASVKETEKRDIETSLQQNNYWTGSLQTMHMLGRDPRRINDRIARADSLSVENIAESMRKYFQDTRYTVVTLLPEVGGR